MAQERPPSQLAGYQMLRPLGTGAFGRVWLAQDERTEIQVAVKFFQQQRAVDWSLMTREAEKLARLSTSRDIVNLIDVGTTHDPPYFIMEYLPKGSLADRLRTETYSVSEAVPMIMSLCRGLVHAHGSGILHCDLKPANVLLTADGQPRLCDFGQSRLSHEQSPALGTLFYMAPEQADMNATPDARWDVYALGAIFYHMLTGKPPHATNEFRNEIASHDQFEQRLVAYREGIQNRPPVSEHRQLGQMDSGLASIIERCLSADPARRFPNAQAVLDRLKSWERNRTRRTLVRLGVLGPAALLLLMIPLTTQAIRVAVKHSEQNLISRVTSGDVISARILARGIYKELQDRQAELVAASTQPVFVEAMQEYDQSENETDKLDRLNTTLRQMKENLDSGRLLLGRKLDTSWFLCDRKGHQVVRFPYSQATHMKNFSYRDYFHGQGLQYDPEDLPEGLEPITEPYISRPFRSNASNQYMVSITVPVWDEQHTSVIGVLGRTTHLWELLDEWQNSLRHMSDTGSSKNRKIALVDARDGQLLDHEWMTQQHTKDFSNEDFRTLSITDKNLLLDLKTVSDRQSVSSSDVVESAGPLVAGEDAVIATDYIDPLSSRSETEAQYEGEWLAAFAAVKQTSWMALVQERKRSAVEPVSQVESALSTYAVRGFILSCLLIGVLWYFLMRTFQARQS